MTSFSSKKNNDKAEHVIGLVLQPMWKTQKLDWTERKNVFVPSAGEHDDDESESNGKHPLYKTETYTETMYILGKEQLERQKNRPLNPPRYQTTSFRKRWSEAARMSSQTRPY